MSTLSSLRSLCATSIGIRRLVAASPKWVNHTVSLLSPPGCARSVHGSPIPRPHPTVKTFPSIPGLYYYPSFLSHNRKSNNNVNDVTASCYSLYSEIEGAINGVSVSPPLSTSVPQPKLFTPKEHNLSTDAQYQRVSITDPLSGHRCQLEYFESYGGGGHSLSYFRPPLPNIPQVARDILPSLCTLQPFKALIRPHDHHDNDPNQYDANHIITRLMWKISFNVYKSITEGNAVKRAGFGFHVDIPSNGVVTAILTLVKPGEIEFRPVKGTDADHQDTKESESIIEHCHLEVGSLLVLSEEARYKWAHRVLPSKSTETMEYNSIGRMSLVFGASPSV